MRQKAPEIAKSKIIFFGLESPLHQSRHEKTDRYKCGKAVLFLV